MGADLIGKTGKWFTGGVGYACICTGYTDGTYSLTVFRPGEAPEFQTATALGQANGQWYPST